MPTRGSNPRVKIGSVIALLVLATSGCGGGGGGGGGSGPPTASIIGNVLAPSSGPGDTQHYFLADPGDEWYFNATTDDATAPAPTSLATLSLGQQLVVNGKNAQAFELLDSAAAVGIDTYYVFSPGGVSFVGNNDATDTISSLVAPYATLLFPVQVGTVSSIHGTNLNAGKNASGQAVTVDVSQTIQNVGVETVTVPAGTFPNAMKQTTAATVTAYAGGTVATGSGTDTTWIVPGVGVVKETSVATFSGTTVNDNHELRGYVVNGNRRGVGAQRIAYSAATSNPFMQTNMSPAAVGSNGNAFALVYPQVTTANNLNYDIAWYAHPLNRDGTSGLTVELTAPTPYTGIAEVPVIASDGANYLVALRRQNAMQRSEIAVSRWDVSLLTASALTTVTPSDAVAPALSFDGSRYLLVYSVATAPLSSHVFGQFISPQTGLADGAAISLTRAGTTGYGPAVAFDGQNYLVVWFDFAGPGETISVPGFYAERVSPTGVVLDADPILIAQQYSAPSTYSPVVAFDAVNFLVAYPDNRATTQGEVTTLSAARISKSGALLDGSPTTPGIVIATAPSTINTSLSLAFISGEYWLAWESLKDSGTIVKDGLYVARISTSGSVTSPAGAGYRLAPAGQGIAPSVAAGIGGGMAVWTDKVQSVADAVLSATVDAVGP